MSRDVCFDERNVTDDTCHEYITAEGLRTVPDWMDANPFKGEVVTGPSIVHDEALFSEPVSGDAGKHTCDAGAWCRWGS